MPARMRKRLSGAKRRIRLIFAAIEVLSEKGYEGASVEEIAGTASVTKPVLYDHFSSKQEIFVAAIEQILDDLLQKGNAAITGEKTPGKQLRATISVFFDLVERDPCAARGLLISSKVPFRSGIFVVEFRRRQQMISRRSCDSTRPHLQPIQIIDGF
jgi:AcrR family transcriptional regulator